MTSGISDDSQSPTSGEYNVCIRIKDSSDGKEESFHVIPDSNLFTQELNYSSDITFITLKEEISETGLRVIYILLNLQERMFTEEELFSSYPPRPRSNFYYRRCVNTLFCVVNDVCDFALVDKII